MRRFAVTLGVAVVIVVAAAVVGRTTGRLVPYDLYTHCGVRYADFDGKRYFAQPPLDDGQGNPPPGWGDPTDSGVLLALGSDRVEFVDPTGHHASFAAHPASSGPDVQICS